MSRPEPLLSFGFAKRHNVLLAPTASGYRLCCGPELTDTALLEIQRMVAGSSNIDLCPSRLNKDNFKALLAQVYEHRTSSAEVLASGLEDNLDLNSLADSVANTEDMLEQENDAPIIRLINALLSEAIRQNASDIHIETFENTLVVRFRVDGILRIALEPRRVLAPLLVSRIKVMAKLDIAEKRVPQDGRIALKIAGREIDVRVSTMPASDGERVVLRLLDKQAGRLDLESLGMQVSDRERFDHLLQRPHGIILVTGPTGSGKTTTLYAGLARVNGRQKNILTIEDPIEYNLNGIGQTQVNLKADMTFSRGLRAILRQDPDVVMVGEIRDLETTQIAIQASLTGHLVLSTLHTNTAIGAITRLEDMGVEPFLLSSSLMGVLAQRLVRVLCPHCKEPYTPDDTEKNLLGNFSDAATNLYRPTGCARCNQQGYDGRTGIYELVVINDALKNLIHNQASEAQLTELARQSSASMFTDGAQRVIEGITSLEEVLRVTQEC